MAPVSEDRAERYRQAAEEKIQKMMKVLEMHDKGYSNLAIAKVVGIPESTVRRWTEEDL